VIAPEFTTVPEDRKGPHPPARAAGRRAIAAHATLDEALIDIDVAALGQIDAGPAIAAPPPPPAPTPAPP